MIKIYKIDEFQESIIIFVFNLHIIVCKFKLNTLQFSQKAINVLHPDAMDKDMSPDYIRIIEGKTFMIFVNLFL